MSNLLEQLRNRHDDDSKLEKTAEDIFTAAFVDELQKLGYSAEFAKRAGFMSKTLKGIKSAFGSASKLSKVKSAQLVKNVQAGPAIARMQAEARRATSLV